MVLIRGIVFIRTIVVFVTFIVIIRIAFVAIPFMVPFVWRDVVLIRSFMVRVVSLILSMAIWMQWFTMVLLPKIVVPISWVTVRVSRMVDWVSIVSFSPDKVFLFFFLWLFFWCSLNWLSRL